MGSSNYIFSLQPTFTQGFIMGQLSILALLAVILKYLFLENEHLQKVPVYADRDHPVLQPTPLSTPMDQTSARIESESTEWFNALLHQVADVYRSKLRDDLQGVEGDEILRQRVEDFANRMRPSAVLDRIQVHSVHLGISAPRLFNARSRLVAGAGSLERSEFDMTYKDDVSISLSTAYLFNYPTIGFARLPVSVTISLSAFSCHAVIMPPSPSTSAPVLTLAMLPNFLLDLKSTSLLGSRAKLADVPKLHELIDSQIRRALIQRGTFKIVLPGLSNVEEAKEVV
ncbi:hypothetical protein B0F90DRAFT_1678996 [Multifurca ochricompacta]|uniref:SMP-LTD domain-containing protein n=1 Tax=Multifurca ochricompacta TaxID=376703 RepID=A0AAD4MDD0_9AGAM|nr:hypothetical protein B0F90DRAFT_1678996 [Multifurca ochricompacta]